jgi:hypothetical protein
MASAGAIGCAPLICVIPNPFGHGGASEQRQSRVYPKADALGVHSAEFAIGNMVWMCRSPHAHAGWLPMAGITIVPLVLFR